MNAHSFRFRPRFRALAWTAIIAGVLLVVAGLRYPESATYAFASAAIGIVLGLLYLRSPAWAISVRADDAGLAVSSSKEQRFSLPWHEVVGVVASAATKTCFVDGGSPERSLLVPGPGASAPYDIENKAVLYQTIIDRVPDDRVHWVELLSAAAAEAKEASEDEVPVAADAQASQAASAATQKPNP